MLNTNAKKITVIGREDMVMLRGQINAALAEVGARFGLKIDLAPAARFTPKNGKFECQVAVQDETGDFETQERVAFKQWCGSFGLKPTDLDRTIVIQHAFSGGPAVTYQITGLLPKNHRYPITAIRISDRQAFKLPVEAVKRAIEKEEALQRMRTSTEVTRRAATMAEVL